MRLTRLHAAAAAAALLLLPVASAGDPDLDSPLRLPRVGERHLRLLSPQVLEVRAITTKAPDPAPLTEWDLADAGRRAALLSSGDLRVRVDGRDVAVTSVGFKRRVRYAPLKARDLRIGNALYLALAAPVRDGAALEVEDRTGRLWSGSLRATADPRRFSPAIHVNQVGYAPDLPKVARVGLYLGSLGELDVPTAAGFEVVDAATWAVVHRGPLTRSAEVGSPDRPEPYQRVYAADFSALTRPGRYRVVVPGLGASYPFVVDAGVPAAFARAYALGLYHQRCGTSNEAPFSRFEHGPCHTRPAEVPTAAHDATRRVLESVTSDALSDPRHTAPRLDRVDASLYPFVAAGPVDVSGGHHDAGDYSKYTINSAQLIHALTFAADAFPGAGRLDDLGLPESGDGRSDLLQEARWEAEFLARMQDQDGGFYFLVYPRERRYEHDVLPDRGDPQVVWPKTTAVTAAATAALAELGSSPRFRAEFPTDAARYLQAARRGWQFLEAALARHGRDGAYQKLTHYGHTFLHDDELAWAAAALFAATGEARFHDRLRAWLRPGEQATRRWGWWRLFEGYGGAVRAYAFAARTGRLPASALDPAYLAACEAELRTTADDHLRFARESAFGTSFPGPSKAVRSAGWYFSMERAFDLAVAWALDRRAEHLAALVSNLDYEAGTNPVNAAYVTGLGYVRQRDVVHQVAQNDARALPPSGLPLGNVQTGFAYLAPYGRELGALSFPPDGGVAAPTPLYDRWGDSFNTTTEFVVVDQARALAAAVAVRGAAPAALAAWAPTAGTITGLPARAFAGEPITAALLAPAGLDPAAAQVVWEAADQEPHLGTTFTFAPARSGEQWVEVEAVWPDGRRVVGRRTFGAEAARSIPPNAFQSAPAPVGPATAALFRLDDLACAVEPTRRLALGGAAALDATDLSWMAVRGGRALRVHDLGDTARVSLPGAALGPAGVVEGVSLSALVHLRALRAWQRRPARLLSLSQGWSAALELVEDPYAGLRVRGGGSWEVSGPTLLTPLGRDRWVHVALILDRTGYTLKLDGAVIATRASDELRHWSAARPAALEVGGFEGWIDEVAVGRGPDPAPRPTTSPAPTTPPTTTPPTTTPPTTTGPAVRLVARDRTTRGDWRGRHGADGRWLVWDVRDLPTGVQSIVTGTEHAWAWSPTDARALQRATSSGRVAACWYGDRVEVQVTLPDDRPRRVAAHLLDWDRLGRAQRVEALDASGAVVLAEDVSSFEDGVYLVFEVRGALRLRLSKVRGPNAVLSALFLDAPPAPPAGTLTIERTASGVRLRVHGAAGERYGIEGSPDLVRWIALGEVTLQGPEAVFDPGPAASSLGFFRAVRR